MKKFALVLAALILSAGSAFAADTATLTVQANVLGTCSFSAPTALLDFVNIDPTSGAAATATTTLGYTCTNGTILGAWTTPATAVIANGGNNITVNLAYSGQVATGTGLPETLTIDGTIPFANYATSPAGLYSGTVLLGINP